MNERRERGLLIALALAFALVATAPWALARAWTPPGHVYTGLHAANQADHHVYLALIEEARRGHLVLHNLFTGEPHPGIQVRPLYTLGGWIARASGCSNEVAFQALRVLAIFAFVPALHALARRFLRTPSARLYAVVLVGTASGFGWLVAPDTNLYWRSVDLWVPEAATFTTLVGAPHFTLSLAVLAVLLAWTHDALSLRPSRARLAATGALALLLALEHPYDVFTLLPIVALACAVRRAGGRFLAACAAGGGLGLGAIAWRVSTVAVFAEWDRQNKCPSPHPVAFALGLGLILPLAVAGLAVLWRRGQRPLVLALGGFAPLALCQAPVHFQRRLVEGAPMALALAAATALVALAERFTSRAARVGLLAASLVALSPTSVLVFAHDVALLREGKPPVYISSELAAALAFLRDAAPEDALVLADPDLGNFVPGVSGKRVYCGHFMLTAQYPLKARRAAEFMASTAPVRLPVAADFVVVGSLAEAVPRPGWLASDPGLAPVFSNGEAAVYRVAAGRGAR